LGAHSAPNPDRYACTNHVLGSGCDNARSVDRKALEGRVLTGLPERMMTPEIAAEAMRAPIRRKPIGSTASAEAHRNPPAPSLPKPRKPSRRSCASLSKAVSIVPCPTG
jgi:hypothetical protein